MFDQIDALKNTRSVEDGKETFIINESLINKEVLITEKNADGRFKFISHELIHKKLFSVLKPPVTFTRIDFLEPTLDSVFEIWPECQYLL